jgi:hypothetical protein
MAFFILMIFILVWYRKNKYLTKRISSCEKQLASLQERFNAPETKGDLNSEMIPRQGSGTESGSSNLQNSDVAFPSIPVHKAEIEENLKSALGEKDSVVNSDSANVPSPPPIPKDKEEIKERPEAALVENNSRQEASQNRNQIFEFIKDNWLAGVGSIACVIGAVFFGITSGLLNHASIRLVSLLIFSILLIVLSGKLSESWLIWKGLLRSIAGAIILFSAVGAGHVEGLKCIESPNASFCLLCAGIAVNVYLASITPFQFIASGHVLLSLIAFWVAPQNYLFLPLSAAIAIIGLLNAYRSRWNIHLILILIGYSIQNMVWTWNLDQDGGMHYLAIFCAIAVSSVAAAIHYSKIYQPSNLKALPFINHISNWILLAWNLYMHAHLFRWSFLALFAAAVIGFFLARIAKKKEIIWLYRTDTCLSQFLAFVAFVSLFQFSINPLDIYILALIQIALFSFIHNLLKENFLVRAGYLFQLLIYICFSFKVLIDLFSLNRPLLLFCRVGVVIAINIAFYIYGRKKDFYLDTTSFIFDEKDRGRYSLMVIFSTLIFLAAYISGSRIFLVPTIAMMPLLGLSIWRARKEELSLDLSFIIILSVCHLYSWILLLFQHDLSFRIDFIILAIIDVILIFQNLLRFKNWKTDIHHLVVYAIAIQISLLTYAYSKVISLYIYQVAFLGYSLIALEFARHVASKARFDEIVRAKVLSGLLHAGAGFLFFFLCGFITTHLQLEEKWGWLSLRVLSELIGCGTFLYWIAYSGKIFPSTKGNNRLRGAFIELQLGFFSLTVFTEIPDLWRPFIWAVLALCLIFCTNHFHWPRRLYTWSWMYLIASIVHVAFVTGYLTHPGQSILKDYLIPTWGAIFLQFVSAFIVHRIKVLDFAKNELSPPQPLRRLENFIYRTPNLTILLPIFLGIALFFAFNFEKTLLTLFWVGLSCAYLSLNLFVKSKGGIRIAMSALIICSIRLLIFDLMQSNFVLRSIVFLGVGILMMLMSMVYKKYKHRIEVL